MIKVQQYQKGGPDSIMKDRNGVFSSSNKYALLLCCAGLVINILGVRIVNWFSLPLYLDNIGSAFTAALGGFIPGIIVGFLTNLINSVGDYTTAYYGSLTVMIAVCSAYYAGRGYYKKLRKLPIIIITFALIGGGLGSILSWALNGFGYGAGVSGPLAERIFSGGVFNRFWSQFAADMVIDLADKSITVVIVALLLRLVPVPARRLFAFSDWHQRPLSIRDMTRKLKRRSRHSLRWEIILLVASATLITTGAVTTISFIHFQTASINEQETFAKGVAKVVRESVDPDRIAEYLEKGGSAAGYEETELILKGLMESSEYIEYCYVYHIEEDGCHVVFDPDTEEVPGQAPGSVVPFEKAFEKYIPDLLEGKPIEPVRSNGPYGWLLTVYDPIYDSAGVCQAYAAVDINMNHIARDGYQFLVRVVSLFLGFFIMILTLVIWLAEYRVILPINSMAMVAGEASYETEEARTEAVESIERLEIRTDDEIENLYTAIVKSTHDMALTTENMAEYIIRMQEQNRTIRKLQNGLILVLADMVESRDQNTGEHVRKTAAYTGVIMRQLRREHIYEDKLTDAFIEDVVNSAPLHDVGKIQVPDAILNKPGKLTDEEFEIMKTHTTAGSNIISSAIDMVSEENSGYLQEARNLAHYHHERWDGKGYPDGLSGTDIPLSARIMAVADVFDALVSKRSYKDGFSYEKAMSIILEERGTHFDPAIVDAFEHAGPEVRSIMESNMGRY